MVHCRYGPSVHLPQLPTPPRGDAVEVVFRREQPNSTGGTRTHAKASFAGACFATFCSEFPGLQTSVISAISCSDFFAPSTSTHLSSPGSGPISDLRPHAAVTLSAPATVVANLFSLGGISQSSTLHRLCKSSGCSDLIAQLIRVHRVRRTAERLVRAGSETLILRACTQKSPSPTSRPSACR